MFHLNFYKAMSFALRTSFSRVCQHSASASRLSHRSALIRTPARRATQTRAMAAQSDVKLDKNTPDSKWKDLLSADEVLLRTGRGCMLADLITHPNCECCPPQALMDLQPSLRHSTIFLHIRRSQIDFRAVSHLAQQGHGTSRFRQIQQILG